MAKWFGGSDHFGCPGSSFSYPALMAAIHRAQNPEPSYTKADLQKWARWYLGIGEYKGHARDKQLRPKRVPSTVPPLGWKILNVMAHKRPVKHDPSLTNAHLVIIDHDGRKILDVPTGHGRVEKAMANFPIVQHSANGPLTVKQVTK